MFYVYHHYRADTNELFYIGKGSGRRAFTNAGRSSKWHEAVKPSGYSVEIVVRDPSEDFIHLVEIEQIDLYRKLGAPLVNQTKGGDGISGYRHTESARSKIAKGNTGKTMSAEARSKISKAMKDKPAHENTRLAAKQTYLNRTEEHKANLKAHSDSQKTPYVVSGIYYGSLAEASKANPGIAIRKRANSPKYPDTYKVL